MPPIRPRRFALGMIPLLAVSALMLPGCMTSRWSPMRRAALATGISKDDLVAHLNGNVQGSDGRPGLASWQSSDVQVQIVPSKIPFSVPGRLAVEAPRNFRLVVNRPMGSQEVDIGSNEQGLWIWTKDEPNRVLTVGHEDIPLAMHELQMPVEIHPDWMMQVFGVVPLRAQDFKLQEVEGKPNLVELVAPQQSSFGEDIERVVRVDLRSGHITEHALRLPGGKIVARALLEHYQKHPSGVELPGLFRLQWPDAQMELHLTVRNPEINPVSLAQNDAIWVAPHKQGMELVDMGAIARSRRGPAPRPTAYPGLFDNDTGEVKLSDNNVRSAPRPHNAPRPNGFPVMQVGNEAPAAVVLQPDPAPARTDPLLQNAAAPEWFRGAAATADWSTN